MLYTQALVLSMILAPISVLAQKVSLETAHKFATTWAKSKATNTITNIVFIDSVTTENIATVYKFKVKPSGFIWVSADYRTAPILAYSFEESHIDNPNNPAGDFLDQYQREVTLTRSGQVVNQLPHEAWNANNQRSLKGMNSDDVVEPMLEVMWGQKSGYNQFTPANTPTGCVAVSMVQIMRHWEWPKQPKGDHSYTHDEYGDLAIGLDTIQFDWASMPFTSPTADIAKAMLYTGYALHMNYAPDGSGASTSKASDLMISSFRFNPRSRYIGMADFGAVKNWVRIIKNELINNRPVIYRGSGTGGHAFNFDGFDGDFFHVNWGWSGSQNGYFLVSSLTPGSNNFSEGQAAAVGLFPDTLLMWDKPYGIRVLASDAKVSLSWDGAYSSQLAYHNIYRNGEIVGESSDRNYTDDTVENGVEYSYSVSCVYSTDSANYESELTSEVAVAPAADFAVPYSQDFEEGCPGWLIANNATGFNWGTPADLGMGSDDTNHVIGINSGTAGNDKLVSDYMTSNGLDLSEQSHVVLSFDYAFRKWQEVDRLRLMYRIFEDNVWVEFAEVEPTKGYHDWANYMSYIPAQAMKENVQIAFFYTDQGEVGYGTLIDNVQLYAVDEPGNPDFETSAEVICQNSEVIFTDQSSGTKDSYLWNFGMGASPKTAETAGPHHVTYSSGGVKTVSLMLNGLDETIKEEALIVSRPPRAKFTKSINFKTVSFTNTSTNAESYFWDFGDGIQMSQESPQHIYAYSGDYLVKLIAISATCGNDTTQQWISFNIAGTDDIVQANKIEIFPNPAEEKLNIELPESAHGMAELRIFNIQGQQVLDLNIQNVTHSELIKVDISDIPNGAYFIQIICDNKIYQKRFQKVN